MPGWTTRRGARSRPRHASSAICSSTAEFADGLSRGGTVRALRPALPQHGDEHDGLDDHDRGRRPRRCRSRSTPGWSAGELAVARAAAAVAAAARAPRWPAAWTSSQPPVARALAELGAVDQVRGEGATVPRARGARAARAPRRAVLGEIRGRRLARAPRAAPRGGAVRRLARHRARRWPRPDVPARAIGWVYGSAERRRGARRLGVAARSRAPSVRPGPPRRRSRPLVGQHAGARRAQRGGGGVDGALGPLLPRDARRGRAGGAGGPGSSTALARGGTQVALVVGGRDDRPSIVDSRLQRGGDDRGAVVGPRAVRAGARRRRRLRRRERATRAARAGAEVIRHPRRLGKGAGAAHGASRRRGRGAPRTWSRSTAMASTTRPTSPRCCARRPGRFATAVIWAPAGAEPRRVPAGRLNAMRVAGFFVNWASGLARARHPVGLPGLSARAAVDAVRTQRGGFVFETEVLMAAAAPRRGRRRGAGARRSPRARAAQPLPPRAPTASPIGGLSGRTRARRGGARGGAVAASWSRVFEPRPAWPRAARHPRAARARGLAGAVEGGVRAAAARRAGAAAAHHLAGGRGAASAPPRWPRWPPRRCRCWLLQAVAGDRLPDVVTPLVAALYGGAPQPLGSARRADAAARGSRRGGGAVMTGAELRRRRRGRRPRGLHDRHVPRPGRPPGRAVRARDLPPLPRRRVADAGHDAAAGPAGCSRDGRDPRLSDQVRREFHDQESDVGQQLLFPRGQPWPNYSYQVPRAEFDTILLDHARKQGVDVHQPATVERRAFDAEGVTVDASTTASAWPHAGALARRRQRARQLPGLAAGPARAHPEPRQGRRSSPTSGAPTASRARKRATSASTSSSDGWFWWIPFADDVTSVGAVMHARTVRERGGLAGGALRGDDPPLPRGGRGL